MLRERRAVAPEIAKTLVVDPDPEVRLEGLKAYVDEGRSLSDDEAKRILRGAGTSSRRLSGIGSLFMPYTASNNEVYVTAFRSYRLSSMNVEDLCRLAQKEKHNASSLYDRSAEFALEERQFRARAERLKVLCR